MMFFHVDITKTLQICSGSLIHQGQFGILYQKQNLQCQVWPGELLLLIVQSNQLNLLLAEAVWLVLVETDF
jgi:hypothetical protein